MGAALGVLLLLTACSGNDGRDDVLVFAASSLSIAFAEVEIAFEEANPSIDVVISTAGSSALREQILDGAPADVFASANTQNLEQVSRAGLLGSPVGVFSTNQIQIAVPAPNVGLVTGLTSFANSDLAIGMCSEFVPCGLAAVTVLTEASIIPSIDTFEPNVLSLVAKLVDGELDAGLVYATNVASSDGALVGVPFGDSQVAPLVTYGIAKTADASSGSAAFIEFVYSDAGQAILANHGFGPAPSGIGS